MHLRHPSLAISAAVVCMALGGCFPFLGTKGSLHETASMGSDLPFLTGLYVEEGEATPCEGVPDDVAFDSTAVCGVCRYMSFAEDGTFVVGRSAEEVREVGPSSPYAAWPGNYRVSGDDVDARAVSPGGDTNYARYVNRFDLRSTGPRSFVRIRYFSTRRQVRFGKYEEDLWCSSHAYTRLESATS